MSSKGSTSPSPSPPHLVEAEPAETKKGEEEQERHEEKSESPKDRSRGRSESPELASDASKSPSPEEGASPEASSSGEKSSEGHQPGAPTEQSFASLPAMANAHVQGDWQAIWSPQHGMYYFHNLRTNETTWTNPLAPSDSSATASTSNFSHLGPQEAAAAAGIDPELAYLDPTLAAGPSVPSPFAYAAKFNARTGAFAKADARNPDHVSEYERMKRMNNFYFDMDAWQQEVEKRQEEEEEAAGKKRKKPTKKDLELFKERKRQKKLAKTAWLRT